MTIVQIIKALVLSMFPIGASPGRTFSFLDGSKEFINLAIDEISFPVVCFPDPKRSNGFRSQGGYIAHSYPIVLIFADKSELDWTPDQHQEVVAVMRKSCDEFVARLEGDTANIRSVAKNLVVDEFINLFDVNMTGVMLTITVEAVNVNNICIS